MSYNFSASSPAMVLPPQIPGNYFASSHYTNGTNGTVNGHSSNGTNTTSTPNESIAPTPGSLAGQKRSRGGDHSPDEDDLLEDGSLRSITNDPRVAPLPGPGLTNTYPSDSAYAFVSGAQTGTLMDERSQLNQFQLGQPVKRPLATTRKSQRVDSDATSISTLPSAINSNDHLAQLVLPPHMREATAEPLIDEATRALGISWTRMDSTEGLRISQAAYSKWIQKHYPTLTDVAVWFENSALPGYLVSATNIYRRHVEYYIFAHDLTEARLVTSNADLLVKRLQLLPALHLAAPGGHIRAEIDPITAAQNEVSDAVQQQQAAAESLLSSSPQATQELPNWAQPDSLCAAHSMELD